MLPSGLQRCFCLWIHPSPFFFFPENLEKYIISPSFPLTLAFLTLEDVSVTTNGSLIFGY